MCHLYKDRRTNIKVSLQNHASPCLTYSVYQRKYNTISVHKVEVKVTDLSTSLVDIVVPTGLRIVVAKVNFAD
jgi:hypothetical protein